MSGMSVIVNNPVLIGLFLTVICVPGVAANVYTLYLSLALKPHRRNLPQFLTTLLAGVNLCNLLARILVLLSLLADLQTPLCGPLSFINTFCILSTSAISLAVAFERCAAILAPFWYQQKLYLQKSVYVVTVVISVVFVAFAASFAVVAVRDREAGGSSDLNYVEEDTSGTNGSSMTKPAVLSAEYSAGVVTLDSVSAHNSLETSPGNNPALEINDRRGDMSHLPLLTPATNSVPLMDFSRQALNGSILDFATASFTKLSLSLSSSRTPDKSSPSNITPPSSNLHTRALNSGFSDFQNSSNGNWWPQDIALSFSSSFNTQASTPIPNNFERSITSSSIPKPSESEPAKAEAPKDTHPSMSNPQTSLISATPSLNLHTSDPGLAEVQSTTVTQNLSESRLSNIQPQPTGSALFSVSHSRKPQSQSLSGPTSICGVPPGFALTPQRQAGRILDGIFSAYNVTILVTVLILNLLVLNALRAMQKIVVVIHDQCDSGENKMATKSVRDITTFVMTQKLLVLSGVYVFCWTPMIVTYFLSLTQTIPMEMTLVAVVTLTAKSTFDPIINLAMTSSQRKRFLRLLKCATSVYPEDLSGTGSSSKSTNRSVQNIMALSSIVSGAGIQSHHPDGNSIDGTF